MAFLAIPPVPGEALEGTREVTAEQTITVKVVAPSPSPTPPPPKKARAYVHRLQIISITVDGRDVTADVLAGRPISISVNNTLRITFSPICFVEEVEGRRPTRTMSITLAGGVLVKTMPAGARVSVNIAVDGQFRALTVVTPGVWHTTVVSKTATLAHEAPVGTVVVEIRFDREGSYELVIGAGFGTVELEVT